MCLSACRTAKIRVRTSEEQSNKEMESLGVRERERENGRQEELKLETQLGDPTCGNTRYITHIIHYIIFGET